MPSAGSISSQYHYFSLFFAFFVDHMGQTGSSEPDYSWIMIYSRTPHLYFCCNASILLSSLTSDFNRPCHFSLLSAGRGCIYCRALMLAFMKLSVLFCIVVLDSVFSVICRCWVYSLGTAVGRHTCVHAAPVAVCVLACPLFHRRNEC